MKDVNTVFWHHLELVGSVDYFACDRMGQSGRSRKMGHLWSSVQSAKFGHNACAKIEHVIVRTFSSKHRVSI